MPSILPPNQSYKRQYNISDKEFERDMGTVLLSPLASRKVTKEPSPCHVSPLQQKRHPVLPGCRSYSIKPFRIVQIFAVRRRIYKWIVSYFAWSISTFFASETDMVVIKPPTTYWAKSPITVTSYKSPTAMQAYPLYIMCHNLILPNKKQIPITTIMYK